MFVDYNVSSDNGRMSLVTEEEIFSQAFEMLLMAEQGDIQYFPTEGIQMDQFLWDMNLKNSDIGNHIANQLSHYGDFEGLRWDIDDIKLVEGPDGDDICFIEYSVGDQSAIIEVVK